MAYKDADRSARSVFVGNIPYDATEEKLKDIFSEVGPVVSFRLVFDRETGKPKGYGFCEYRDMETANSAMRNLNGYELGARPLRVDSAANERAREELQNLHATLPGPFESPYGPEVDPEQAPETISKAVASLPPEQMFELAKQMRQCIQTNPNEARNMLLQNPQLSYALLQALVIMRVLDPQQACSILYRQNEPATLRPFDAPQPPAGINQPYGPPRGAMGGPVGGHQEPAFWASSQVSGPMGVPAAGPVDPRNIDPRLRDGPKWERENRGFQDPRFEQRPVPPAGPVDPRAARDPRFDPRTNQMPVAPAGGPSDPRAARADPRIAARGNAVPPVPDAMAPGTPPTSVAPSSSVVADQEKAALIMQVLNLTEAQIAQLPPDQRESVMLLRQQLAQQGT